MPFLIDAHQDLAYNTLTFGRDYLRSALDIRQSEKDTNTAQFTGQATLGWPEYQRGQIAAIFATLFLTPRRYAAGGWETQTYADPRQARPLFERQFSYYQRLAGDHPDKFRLVSTRSELKSVLEPWETTPAHLPRWAEPASRLLTEEEAEELARQRAAAQAQDPDPREPVTHPVGLILLMEGAEGIEAPEALEEWWERGVRLVGPVWAGTRFCGGMYEPGEFTREGYALLDVMAGLGMVLDISHMNEVSALQALDRYPGTVVATHANARALVKGRSGERHLTDTVIRQLIERDGMIGVLPFNIFLHPTWSRGEDRQAVTLRSVAAHIDYICQIAGNALHVGLGTDFDGGFGWPDIPVELDTIADLPKLAPVLAEMGYTPESIAGIFGNNWRQVLERSLPDS